jgi:flavin-binding protein dodecin
LVKVIPQGGTEKTEMTDHTYRIIELAGSSEISHADAIENAIARASKTTRNLRWFEVTQQRGEIEDGEVRHYQVTMKVGFTVED